MGGGELTFTRKSQILYGGGVLNEDTDPLVYGKLNQETGDYDPSAPKYLKARFRVSGAGTLNHCSLGFRGDEPTVVDTAPPYGVFAVVQLLDAGVIGISTNYGGLPASAPVADVSWADGEEIELMAMVGQPRLNEPGAWRFRAFVNGKEVFATNLPFTFVDPGEGFILTPLFGFIQTEANEPIVQTTHIEFGDVGDLKDPH
jgi:hypothetical protein